MSDPKKKQPPIPKKPDRPKPPKIVDNTAALTEKRIQQQQGTITKKKKQKTYTTEDNLRGWAELAAMRKYGVTGRPAAPASPQPPPKNKKPKIISRVNVWGEREYAPGHHPKKRGGGGKKGGGGRAKIGWQYGIPEKGAYQKLYERYRRWPGGGLTTSSIVPSVQNAAYKRARDADIRRKNSPQFLMNRRLYNIEMAKLEHTEAQIQLQKDIRRGISPHMSAVRSEMIARMNRLRAKPMGFL